jgi:hypothetical protein
MKKVAFLVVFFTIAINGLAQNSRQDLMDYLAKNVNSLDPIEGLYDVEWNCRYITPFVDQSYGIFSASMIIVKRNDGTFYIAYGSGYGFDSYEYKILNNITILLIAFSVSIDAFTVGIAFGLNNELITISSLIFSIVSTFFTYLGLSLGKTLKNKYKKLSTYLGIILLLIVAFKYLLNV